MFKKIHTGSEIILFGKNNMIDIVDTLRDKNLLVDREIKICIDCGSFDVSDVNNHVFCMDCHAEKIIKEHK